MLLDFETLDNAACYQWMVHLVVPRPIGWVSTVDEQGRPNLAPFSWFQTVCTMPPLLMVALGYKRGPDGEPTLKDTLRNAESTGECVIQLAERPLIEQLVESSAALPHGESEFELTGLEPRPSERVKPPRVKEARVAFECVVEEILVRERWQTRLLIARILCAQLADDLVNAEGDFVAERWSPVARLGGLGYAEIGERFELSRPG